MATSKPDAYAEGFAAWEAGKPRSANPYPVGSAERPLWTFGWEAAEDHETWG